MSLNTSGLYGKYRIEKANGELVDPKADYFVLRLDTDPFARIALREYANRIEVLNRSLAKQLMERIDKYDREVKQE